MKRFQFISRLATSVAVVALSIGSAVTLSACSDDIDDVNNEPVIVQLDTPTELTATPTGADLQVSWAQVKGQPTYSAQVRYSKYGDVIRETITELTSVTFTDLENGTYVVRVRANDPVNEKQNSNWSEWLEDVVIYVAPDLTQLDTPKDPVSYASKNTETSLTFAWEPVEKAGSYTYKLTYANGDSFKEDITDELTTEITGLTPSTTYIFMVKANPAKENEDTYRASSYSKSVTVTTVGKLSTPADLKASLRMAEALTFSWQAVENAAGYEYEFYEGSAAEPVLIGSTIPAEEEEEIAPAAEGDIDVEITSNTSVSFRGLQKDSYYSLRVKAIAEGNAYIESDFTDYCIVKTLITDATPLDAPKLTVDAKPIELLLSWNAVSGAKSYELQYGATTAQAEAAEPIVIEADELGVLATEYKIKDLTPESTFYVHIKALADPDDTTKIDSEYSAWTEAKTDALYAAYTIKPGDFKKLSEVLPYMAEGGVLTLEKGTYVTTETLTLLRGITIKGTDANDRPRVNLKQIELPVDGATKIEFANIEFTCCSVDDNNNIIEITDHLKEGGLGGYFINNGSQKADVDELIVDNCLVHSGFTSAFIRINRATTTGVKNLTITNNVAAVGGNDGGVVSAGKVTIACGKWIIKNNTFEVGTYYTASKTGDLITLPDVTNASSFEVEIENNTFYNSVYMVSGKYPVQVNDSNCTPSVLTFKNNIVAGGVWNNKWGKAIVTNCENNFTTTEDITIDGVTSADPQITGYVFLKNYTTTNPDVAGAGDSRWIK